jgi:hypothetical protein
VPTCESYDAATACHVVEFTLAELSVRVGTIGRMTLLFLGREALAANALPERAMRSLYEPIHPGVYGPGGIALTARERAQAAWLWSRRKGVIAGEFSGRHARGEMGEPDTRC